MITIKRRISMILSGCLLKPIGKVIILKISISFFSFSKSFFLIKPSLVFFLSSKILFFVKLSLFLGLIIAIFSLASISFHIENVK
jgi:hypothetical protein